MRRKGFTLIELLVVIAIIAILAAILFPVFASAKGNARRAKCQVQLKQIMAAVHAYMGDWQGYLPALNLWTTAKGGGADFSDISSDIAKGSLYRYLGSNKKIMCCPNDWRWKDKRYQDKFWFTYCVNSYCTWYTQRPLPIPGANSRLLSNYMGVPISRFPLTSRTVFLVEENTDPEQGYLMNDALFHGIDITANRHTGKAAVTYLDGHIGLVPAGLEQYSAKWPNGTFIFHP